jgi:hypothetical protein
VTRRRPGRGSLRRSGAAATLKKRVFVIVGPRVETDKQQTTWNAAQAAASLRAGRGMKPLHRPPHFLAPGATPLHSAHTTVLVTQARLKVSQQAAAESLDAWRFAGRKRSCEEASTVATRSTTVDESAQSI